MTREGTMDIGQPPPDPAEKPESAPDPAEKEDFRQKCLRRQQEEEMRQAQTFDMSGGQIFSKFRWNEHGQIEVSTDDGATWQVFCL